MNCEVCRQTPDKYQCPRCTLRYCSVECYRADQHADCLQQFAEQHIREAQQQTPLQKELAKEQILLLLHRLEQQDSLPEDLSSLTVEQMEEMLGAEELARFQEAIEQGGNEGLERILGEYRPWWLNQEACNHVGFKLPSLLTLTRKQPSEHLWGNLVELLSVYCHHTRLALGEDEGAEFQAGVLHDSRILADPTFTHYRQLMEALKHDNVEDVTIILGDPGKLQQALKRLAMAFTDQPMVSRKLHFYRCWLADELRHHGELAEEILHSMVALLQARLNS